MTDNNAAPITQVIDNQTLVLPEESLAKIPEFEMQLINRARESIINIRAQVHGLIIADDQGAENASANVVTCRKTKAELEKRMKFQTKPLTDKAAQIRVPYKILMDELDLLDKTISPKVVQYDNLIEARRKAQVEADRRAELEALEKQKAEQMEQAELNQSDHALQDAADTEQKIEDVKTAKVAESVSKVSHRTASGATTSRRKHLVIEIVDSEKIEKKYLVRKVERSAVTLDFKRGVREFAGLNVFEESTLATRTTR